MLMVFLTTSYAIVLLHLVNARGIVGVYRRLISDHKLAYLRLNIALLVVWIGTFLIPIYFTPSSLLIAVMGLSGLCGLISRYIAARQTSTLVNTVLVGLTLALYYLLYLRVYSGWTYAAFVSSTLVVGLVGYAALRFSADMLTYGFSSPQILAVRFWLLWLISLVFVLVGHQYELVTVRSALYTGGLGLVSMILPIFFLQKAIEKLGPNRTGVLLGFTPLVVVVLEFIWFREMTDIGVVPALLMPAITIGFAIYDQRRARRAVAVEGALPREN